MEPTTAAGLSAGATSVLTADYTSSTSKGMAKKANKRNKYNYQHRKQWEVEDLKAAGLNPILAAGGTGGAVPNAPMAQAPTATVAKDAISGSMSQKQKQLISAQINQVNSAADFQKAQAANSWLDNVQKERFDKWGAANPNWSLLGMGAYSPALMAKGATQVVGSAKGLFNAWSGLKKTEAAAKAAKKGTTTTKRGRNSKGYYHESTSKRQN